MPINSLRYFVSLSLFIICFSLIFVAQAQDARIVEVGSWGSQPYNDVVAIDDYYYFSSDGYTIDVYQKGIASEEALLGTLKFEEKIVSIINFKGQLVVADTYSLKFYQVDGLVKPTLLFGISLSGYNYSGNDAFAIDGNTLAYISTQNSIYVVEHDNEHIIVGTQHFGDEVLDYDSYYKALGIEENALYLANTQCVEEDGQYACDLMLSHFKMNEGGITLLSQNRQSFDEDSITSTAYLSSGRFAATLDSKEMHIYRLVNDNYELVKRVESLTSQAAAIGSYGDEIYRLSFKNSYGMNLTRFDFAGNELSSVDIENLPNSHFLMQQIPNGLLVINDSGLFELLEEEGQYSSADELYYQGGRYYTPVVEDNTIFLPSYGRIDILEMPVQGKPKLLKQVKDLGSFSSDSVFGYQGQIYLTLRDKLKRYDIDEEMNLIFSAEIFLNGAINRQHLNDHFLFVQKLQGTFLKFDLSTQNSFFELPSEFSVDSEEEHFTFYDVQFTNDFLIASDIFSHENYGLYVFDNLKGDTEFANFTEIENSLYSFGTFNDIVYIYDSLNYALNILRIADDGSISKIRSQELTEVYSGSNVHVIDEFLVLSGNVNDLSTVYLYSLADPEKPKFVSSTTLSKGIEFSRGDNLLVKDGFIYNVSSSLNIMQMNYAPDDAMNTYHIEEDTTLVINVTDWDPEGDEVVVRIINEPAHGTFIFDEDSQTLLYTPNPDFNGTDTAQLTVQDIHGGKGTMELIVDVTPFNDTPVIIISELHGFSGSSVSIGPIAFDIDDEPLTYFATSIESQGEVDISQEGNLVFSPALNFDGVAIVDVTVADPSGVTVHQSVSIDMSLPEISEDQIAQIALDNLFNGDTTYTLSVLSFTEGLSSVERLEDLTLQFTPTLNFFGNASVTIKAIGDDGVELTYAMQLKILPVNDPPVAEPMTVTVNEGIKMSGELSARDIDSDTLTFTAAELPKNGTLTLSQSGTFDYQPNTGFNGQDSFTYQVSDEEGNIDSATVILTIKTKATQQEASGSGGGGGSFNACALLFLLSLSLSRGLFRVGRIPLFP
ncbi:Ig-like domain-containing protein [Paraglaciecola mesophila]|uniref:Ig-like domain-containing protein n=1 Tax=Paraglaciecola mesophila TaxID=197222 RepID=A0ABU9SWH6_9ALTE